MKRDTKYLYIFLTALFILSLFGCTTLNTIDNGKQQTDTTRKVFKGPLESRCSQACSTARALTCPQGMGSRDIDDLKTCEDFCINTEKLRHDLQLDCRIKASTCAEMTSCDKDKI